MSGLLTRFPPLFNLTVSNVIASAEPQYFYGAEMEAIYPMSVLFDGHTLNVTVVGYAGKLSFGVTGCRDTSPNLQKLAVYAGEALADLEAAVAKRGRAGKGRKLASRRKKS